MPPPWAYLITFHTYGTWLHGREEGSVDPNHNTPCTPFLPADRRLAHRDAHNLKSSPYVLEGHALIIVDKTVREVCSRRSWKLHALNVRTTHVHAVVSAPVAPERVMNDFKAWCTRRLSAADLAPTHGRPWSRHGSTRWLNSELAFRRACAYTLREQGADLVGIIDQRVAEHDAR